jgi:6-phosphofructokinase 1
MARGENCLIAVAGAPTAVTNSAIAGIIDEIGQGSDIADVYGAPAGIPGVIEGKVLDLGAQKRKVIEGLRRTPGSVLSGRYRPLSDAEGTQLIGALRERNVGTLFLLGGLSAVDYARAANDAAKAADYELTVLVIPLSAENEVAAGDHNPGYGSAARFAAILARDAGRAAQGGEEPLVVLEIGGAGSGWLAAATALSRDAFNTAPHTILLPERPVNTENMIEEVRRAVHRFGHAVAVTTEGAHDLEGNSLDGASLAELLEDSLNLPTRYDRLGASVRVSGANVARADSDEAYSLGALVVRLAGDGFSGYLAALNRDADGKGEKGYKVIESTKSLDQVEEGPKALPAEFIAETGTGVSETFLEWARPLIGGALPEYTSLG